jgi:hypothetical protein
MAKSGPKTAASIQKLLDEREQIQRWLERLTMAADAAPENVRTKVRHDYERRLQEVMAELQGHGQDVGAALERQRSAREGLAGQEEAAAERLEEAELRHAVGEYDEGQWRTVHAELVEALVTAREELKRADEEIARLEDVVELVGSEPEPAEEEAEPEPPPAKKGPTPRKAAAKAGQTEAFDELAFLRSVTEDESHGPAPSRASGAMTALPDPPPASAGPPPSAAPGSTEFRDPEHNRKDTLPRASRSMKSLKCGECGTMNLPTEWYCERCGAELAAV